MFPARRVVNCLPICRSGNRELFVMSVVLEVAPAVRCGRDGEKPRRKRRSERALPPVFDVVVEVVALDRWRVHGDVAASVDALLEGTKAPVQVDFLRLMGANMRALEGSWSIRMVDELSFRCRGRRYATARSSKNLSGPLHAVKGSSSCRMRRCLAFSTGLMSRRPGAWMRRVVSYVGCRLEYRRLRRPTVLRPRQRSRCLRPVRLGWRS